MFGHLYVVVDQRREEVVLLEADLARLKSPAPQPGGENSQLSQASAPSQKLPVPVELIHNQIAPVTRDFFKCPVSSKPTYTATRSRRGETIQEASKPDSLFGKFLGKLRPNREYMLAASEFLLLTPFTQLENWRCAQAWRFPGSPPTRVTGRLHLFTWFQPQSVIRE